MEPTETIIKRNQDPVRVTNIEQSENECSSGKPYPAIYQSGTCKDPDQFQQDFMHGIDDNNPRCVLYLTLACKPADISGFFFKK